MNRLPFTKYASKALNEGREIAGYLGFKDVSSIFVLLGLYGADGSLASEVLKMHGVTRELIEEAIKEKSKMPKDRRRTVMDTPKTEYLLEIAGELAMKYGCEAIGSEHILMAMIKDGDNEAFRFLEDHKISSEGIYTDILVTAGIDFSKIMIDIDEDTKIITITLPESEIQNTMVDFGSMDYIFENKKYETETVSQEAYELCKTDLARRAAKENDLMTLAKENAVTAVEALVDPWVQQIDGEYKVNIK